MPSLVYGVVWWVEWRDVQVDQPSSQSSQLYWKLILFHSPYMAHSGHSINTGYFETREMLFCITYCLFYHNGPLSNFFLKWSFPGVVKCPVLGFGGGEWWKRVKKWNQQVSGQERRGFEWAVKSWKQEGVTQGKLERCGDTFKRAHWGEMRRQEQFKSDDVLEGKTEDLYQT